MKTVLKFSGIISAVIAIVAFILILACPGVITKGNFSGNEVQYSGTLCIFGGEVKGIILTYKYSATWAGLLAFILIIVALVILCCAIILPLLKVKVLDKFAGVLNLVAVISLILAGIFAFCIVAAFKAANGDGVASAYGVTVNTLTFSIGAGWVIAGILSIVAGVFAVLPAAFDLFGKK